MRGTESIISELYRLRIVYFFSYFKEALIFASYRFTHNGVQSIFKVHREAL